MAGAALLGRLSWQLAEVAELRDETSRTKSIFLDVPEWPGHRAGQHVDVRLTAEDGYQAQRSYSIGSGPEDDHLVLTVERLDDGEVSPYLTEGLIVGDQLELRGPIGGYFVWEPSLGGPLLLVAGGSGIVPLPPNITVVGNVMHHGLDTPATLTMVGSNSSGAAYARMRAFRWR